MAFVGSISGSAQSNSLIAFSGSAIFGKRADGLFPQMPGSDVVWFVSGSSGSDKSSFGGDVVVSGSLAVNGGDLTSSAATFNLLNATVTTLNIGAGASEATNIGHASGLTTIAGDLQVSGNDIKASGGTTALTFSGADVAVAGDLTVTGNDIKASGGTTAISLSGANVTIAGDLTVNGTTTTVNSTTLTVDDKNIELGSTATPDDAGADGGGITLKGSTDHTIIWRNSQDAWEFSEHLVPDGGSLDLGLTGDRWRNLFLSGDGSITGDLAVGDDLAVNGDDLTSSSATFNLLNATVTTLNLAGAASTALNIGHASGINTVSGKTAFSQGLSGSLTKLADGTSYIIAGGGITVASASNGAITITGQAGGGIGGSNTQVQFNDGGAFGGDSGLTYNKTTDTLTTATGSFGSVLASSTSTFTGATTHNGGITGTTLGLSSNASVLGTLAATGNITGTGTSNQLNSLAVTGSIGLSVTSGVTVGTTLGVTGAATFNGAVILGDAGADTITYNGQVGSNILPYTDRLYNLGSPSYRWANIYTGDLHLRNERGNWTVVEEEAYLSIRNNISGKMFKFVLEEIVLPDSAE